MLCLTFLGCGWRHPRSKYDVVSVPESATEEVRQTFDVVVDAAGSLHLVWQTATEGLNYQVSRDAGETWTRPLSLAETSRPDRFKTRGERPRVFVDNEMVVVLWQDYDPNGAFRVLGRRVSPDGGRSWEASEEAMELYWGLGRQELVAKGPDLFLAYGARTGYFVRRSEDLGQSWNAAVKIAEYPEGRWRTGDDIELSLAVDDRGVYCLHGWRIVHQRLSLSVSLDHGASWTPPAELELGPAIGGAYPKIYAKKSGIELALVGSNRFYILDVELDGNVPGSRSFRMFSSANDMLYMPDGSRLVAWCDGRYRVTKMRINPLDYLVGRGSILWENSDLTVATLRSGRLRKKAVVTPMLSWVSPGRNQVRLINASGRALVFWSGRRKVGRTLDAYGAPTEVLYARLR